MFARGGKILTVLMLVLTTGLHWAALQTVAWSTMLADNLRTESMTEAMTRTFDGMHPCCLCKAIAAAKKSQKQTEITSATAKFEFPPVAAGLALFPPSQFVLLPDATFHAALLSSEPVVPPPRDCSV